MELQQLNPSDLKLGIPLPWSIYDIKGHMLLSRGTVVSNENQFIALCGRGAFADAEEKRKASQATAQNSDSAAVFNPFHLWEKLESRLGQLLQQPPNPEDFGKQMVQLCQMIEILSTKDPDAGLAVMHLHDHPKYAISHSVHCALVSNLVARRINVSAEERRAMVAAALTMNVSMIELQCRLALQHTPLSTNQRDTIQNHPENSHRWLIDSGVGDEMWLDSVLQHHESESGNGYPKHIDNPSRLSQLIRMSDIFCAKIAGRATRRALAPNLAMRAVFCNSDGVNCDLVSSLIKEMGVYPPGTYVKLANGELAIVVKRGKTADSPVVMSLVNNQGMPNMHPMRRETEKAEFAITSTTSKEKVITRISLPKLWGY